MVTQLKKDILKYVDLKRAEANKWFFKTGKGEYGEGDKFIGLTVPLCRQVAEDYKNLTLEEILEILKSPIHEERLIALIILVNQFKRAGISQQKKIADFYIANMKYINNWDLVDSSASQILGNFLVLENRDLLRTLAQSQSVWERRIAIVSTFAFIKLNQYKDSLETAKILLKDKHDLIHKAVGWVLREVGKKSENELVNFLGKYYKEMPRTMLRYAIEKFPEETRMKYLIGEI